ncbi:MAG: hypothetical protein NC390_06020 [Fusobacterium sp.]|nr:hypothetical protein [Fusobacterium sp.]
MVLSARSVLTVDGLISAGYTALKGVTKKGEKVYRKVVESPSKFGNETAVKTDYVVLQGEKTVKKFVRNVTGNDDRGTIFNSLNFESGNQKEMQFFHAKDGSFQISRDEYTGAFDYLDENLVRVPRKHRLETKHIIVDKDRNVKFAHSTIQRGRGNKTIYDLNFLYPAYKLRKERFVGKHYEEVEMPKFVSLNQTLTDKNIFV